MNILILCKSDVLIMHIKCIWH